MMAEPTETTEPQRVVNSAFGARVGKWRSVYDDRTVFGVIHQRRRESNLEWIDSLELPKPATVLEVGCGAGLTTVALAQRGFQVEAMDAVPGMIETTLREASLAGVSDRVKAGLGDAHHLDLPSDSFPLVVAMGVIPWLHSPRVALSELARVAAPGGYVLLNTDNRYRLAHLLDPVVSPPLQGLRWLYNGLRKPFRAPSGPPEDATARGYSPRQFDGWVKEAGLRKLRGLMVGYGPFTFWRRSLLSDERGIRVHEALQSLADRGFPLVGATAAQYIVLARKG